MDLVPVITTFKTVDSVANALIVVDFDETIIHYPCGLGSRQWWESTFNKYFDVHGNYEEADKESLLEWKAKAEVANFVHTDEEGLRQFMDAARSKQCQVICLTARSAVMIDVTESQRDVLNVQFDDLALGPTQWVHRNGIHFASTVSKGKIIAAIFKTTSFKKIVFIDDLEKNIRDVQTALEHDKIIHQCYQFKLN